VDAVKKSVGKEERGNIVRSLLAQVRAAYANQEWGKVRTLYATLSDTKPSRGVLVEAGYLAVSAAVAGNDKRGARKTLGPLLENEYPKAVHYEFLARACLDLKQYANALQAIARAEALQKEEAEAR